VTGPWAPLLPFSWVREKRVLLEVGCPSRLEEERRDGNLQTLPEEKVRRLDGQPHNSRSFGSELVTRLRHVEDDTRRCFSSREVFTVRFLLFLLLLLSHSKNTRVSSSLSLLLETGNLLPPPPRDGNLLPSPRPLRP